MSDLFNEVEREMRSNRSGFGRMPLFFKLWFAFVLTGVIAVFSLVIYSFIFPEKVAARYGHVAGVAMREAERAYNEQ